MFHLIIFHNQKLVTSSKRAYKECHSEFYVILTTMLLGKNTIVPILQMRLSKLPRVTQLQVPNAGLILADPKAKLPTIL